MKNLNKVKFFLVAATLIGGMSSAMAFDWGGDPNEGIGSPGTLVVDTALDKPLSASPHDCPNCTTNDPLNGLFEARSANGAVADPGSAQDAKQ